VPRLLFSKQDDGTMKGTVVGTTDVYSIERGGVPTRYVAHKNGRPTGIEGPIWCDVYLQLRTEVEG